mmetsp:Transcript_11457/g.26441  ORF Transcript_11457/g.26441 Transcript_11457/m.26441 type:complete len:231 (+) Transcript_11457:735-1427(+)
MRGREHAERARRGGAAHGHIVPSLHEVRVGGLDDEHLRAAERRRDPRGGARVGLRARGRHVEGGLTARRRNGDGEGGGLVQLEVEVERRVGARREEGRRHAVDELRRSTVAREHQAELGGGDAVHAHDVARVGRVAVGARPEGDAVEAALRSPCEGVGARRPLRVGGVGDLGVQLCGAGEGREREHRVAARVAQLKRVVPPRAGGESAEHGRAGHEELWPVGVQPCRDAH